MNSFFSNNETVDPGDSALIVSGEQVWWDYGAALAREVRVEIFPAMALASLAFTQPQASWNGLDEAGRHHILLVTRLRLEGLLGITIDEIAWWGFGGEDRHRMVFQLTITWH